MNRIIRSITAAILLSIGTINSTDCGPYPFEFQTLCSNGGVMIAECRSDGNWVFVGCWVF